MFLLRSMFHFCSAWSSQEIPVLFRRSHGDGKLGLDFLAIPL